MKRQFMYGALGILALASCKEEPKIMDGNVVRVNQVGYYPNEEKTATVEAVGFADECYLDNVNSYASNEIAINWNASLFAMVGWLDALLK